MSKLKEQQQQQQQHAGPVRKNPNESDSNEKKPLSRASKSLDKLKARQSHLQDIHKVHINYDSLEDYGYHFKNGKFVSFDANEPFEFHVFQNNEENYKRYNAIGRLVTNYIYGLLEQECNLIRIPIPIDAKRSEPTGFFFASDNLNRAEYMMIIIHGTGSVRAGQWSRKLIINQDIATGSQIDYIKRARVYNYAVIVTNTNLNTDESVLNATKRIRGSESPEDHAAYIWEFFVRRSPARHICIMAHSYGGAVVVELASKFSSEFDKRVFAVALSDSPMKSYTKHCSKSVLEILKKKTINWAVSEKPPNTFLFNRDYGTVRAAGHTLHEWTSYTAFDYVFEFFHAEREKLERNKK